MTVSKVNPILGVATALSALSLLAFLTFVVVRRDGNLAWDDADYLREGLRIAGVAGSKGIGAVPSAIGMTLRERPKPPLLVAWVELGAVLLGRRWLDALIVFSSVVPFAMLVGAVSAVAWRRYNERVALLSVVLLAASPLALSYGAKVMVETFMSLWILMVLHAAAMLLERPSVSRATGLGIAIGLAMMTKLTVALLLPVPLGFTLYFYVRRYPLGRESSRVALACVGSLSLVAGPWYALNLRSAVRHAVNAADYPVRILGLSGGMPRWQRIPAMAGELVGWPLCALLMGAALLWLGGWRRVSGECGPRPSPFTILSIVGAIPALAFMLLPSHFDVRFVLPLWPALAICAASLIESGPCLRSPMSAAITGALLIGCVGASANSMARESVHRTYWHTNELIDFLAARYQVKSIGNIGNSSDWNVCKTGLINELRPDPSSCFVLHDLSNATPTELERRIGRFDAVLVLDRAAIPPHYRATPGLNRAYDAIDRVLARRTWFRKVDPKIASDLPAMSIYVRR